MSQGAYDPWWRQLVNRAVYLIRRGVVGAAYRAALRYFAGAITSGELGQVTRTARAGINVAAAAGKLPATARLAQALGGRTPPAEAVEVEVVYRVEHPELGEKWRTARFPDPRLPGGGPTWHTTVAEIRAAVEAIEELRSRSCWTGAIDWDTAVFDPPLWFPPMPT